MANLRKEARGRECQIRIPGYCNGNSETTIPAHLNGGGMGMKVSDLQIAWSCSVCHDVVDGRISTRWDSADLKLWHQDGVFRTQQILEDEGVIKY
jgi:hypothetical protein